MATEMREHLNLRSFLSKDDMEDLLRVKLPLPMRKRNNQALCGGYSCDHESQTSVLVASKRVESQRFDLARLIGSAMVAVPGQHVLPVTSAGTAMQKFERSFAQELLCPWDELDTFTDEHGTDDEAIQDAAAHFQVSQMVIATTLVNRKKMPRQRLFEL